MSDLLVGKKVAIADPYLLQFFYPRFSVVSDLNQPIDYSKGVIYTGIVSGSTQQRLTWLTRGMFIIVSQYGDVILETPKDFINTFMPYLSDKADKYLDYPMDEFIPVLKQHWILNRRIVYYKEVNQGVYALFRAMSSSKNDLYSAYFSLLETMPAYKVASSVLTFLQRVYTQNYDGAGSEYKLSINKAYLKFGKNIKQAILQYVKSNQSPEVALFFLLDSLNG